jgi:hypothetical protein
MVKGGFKRIVDENDEDTFEFVLSDRKILEILYVELRTPWIT